jgi:citronellol/citronellal dehydrogenase
MTKTTNAGTDSSSNSNSRYRSIFRPGLFAGKTVVVTGAGSGIGRCTAHELSALGAKLALVGRKPEKLELVRQEILAADGFASSHPADIRDEESVESAMQSIMETHGRIDALVNNAGGQYPAPLEAISLKGWNAVLNTNLTGGFMMAKAALHFWMKAHGGAIVNMTADMWSGMPGMGHSGAARAGMLNFTETAACEWACYGIRVNAVAPGWIASSGFDTYDATMKAQLRRLKKSVPLQRFGTESEVAGAIVFLLSDAAAFITGTCLRIDGGVPNARHTWPAIALESERDATAAFNGFHLASEPKMLSED